MRSIDKRLATCLSHASLNQAQRRISQLDSENVCEQSLVGRILLAERTRDTFALERIAGASKPERFCSDPDLIAELVLASRWTLGLGKSRAVFRWASRSLPRSDARIEAVRSFIAASRHAASLPEIEPCASARAEPFVSGFPVPVVRISVNNHPPEPFIVDTGAPSTLLSHSFCRRAGLVRLRSRRMVRDASGFEIELSPVPLGEFVVAGTRVRGTVADAAPIRFPLDVSGIFSPCDLLPSAAVELDFVAGRMRVLPEEAIRNWTSNIRKPIYTVPLVWDDGNMFVSVRAGKGTGWFVFDTGASSILVTRPFAPEAGWVRTAATVSYTRTAAHRTRIFGSLRTKVSLGAERPRAVKLVVRGQRATSPRAAPLRVAGWLGVPWMKGRRILFERSGRCLRYSDPS